jgi:hypothetical protein
MGLILAMTLALMPGAIAAADKAPAVVFLQPQFQTISKGATTSVQVWVNNVVDFYGIEFHLQFDPLILDGVDIVRGAAFPVANSIFPVHNFTGNMVNFSANLVGVPAPPLGNMHVATITFRGREVGSSSLIWPAAGVVVANAGGFPIPHLLQNGGITVQSTVDVGGFAFMGGRTFPFPGHAGIAVDLVGSSTVLAATTLVDGNYTFPGISTGTYNLHFNHKFYLTTHLQNCIVGAPGPVMLPAVTLVPGDLNGDQRIDILDLATCAAKYGLADPLADVNGDGVVNLLDLVLIGANFGKIGPILQPC